MPKKEIARAASYLLKRYPYCRQYNMIWSKKKEPPFKVLIGTILSQRSRDETTERVSRLLFSKYPDAQSIASLPLKQLEKLVKPSGPYHQKAHNIKRTCEALISKHRGKVPRTEEELMQLPGVGQKTADCVLLYGYGKAVIPVDTHVHKLSNLFGWVKTRTPEQTKAELEKLVKGNRRKIVNCVLVSLGQETRYNKESLVKTMKPVMRDIGKRVDAFKARRKEKGFDR
jgi:endonuclease-3